MLDTANPRVPLLEAMIRISDAVPRLRIVLDHLPSLDPAEADRGAYDAAVQELGKRPQIFVKLSAIIHRVNGQVSTELGAYRARLDRLLAVFGEDRILFGSDWPNSDGVAPVDRVFAMAKEYFLAQPRPVAEKYFWRNSVAGTIPRSCARQCMNLAGDAAGPEPWGDVFMNSTMRSESG